VSRDHRKLRVFVLADGLVTEIYRATGDFPAAERFALQSQLRRAAVSVASNIVEGSARRTTRDYLNFLNVAAGSAAEARYLIELSHRLGLLPETESQRLCAKYTELAAGLQALIRALKPRASGLEP
jgi:four helix bundle protein